MSRITSQLFLAALFAGSIFVQAVPAKEYPTRPIEIFCSYSPGSTTDLISRVVAEMAPKYLGQPMVVVNKTGAGGSIAAGEVISSEPDGYKLAFSSSFFFATTIKTQKLLFDPNYLVPLANFAEMKIGMVVRSDSPWKNLNDLLDYARKNPAKLRWGHPGRGILNHIGGLLIFRKSGVNTIDVPYKGSPEMTAALLGGHLDAISIPYGAIKDHVKGGTVRFLVFYSDQRYSDPSGVPSALELGFPEAAKLKALLGIYVHKDCPENVRKILAEALKKTCENPELKKGIEKVGEEYRCGTPAFIMDAIKKSEEVGVPILKELGLYVKQN
jgi:tripartite-type tricarboxylate transporter receptor subunit TctC